MANKAKVKTAKQRATEAAYVALGKAEEAHEKTPNATTKAALDKAQSVHLAAKNEERRERFVNIGGSRVGIVIAKINALAKCANKRSYEFSEDDIKKMDAVLSAAFEQCLGAYQQALAGKPTAAVASKFTFE